MSSALWSPFETALRVYGMISRGTIKKINDKSKLQELDIELLHEEEKTGVEVMGQYGFKSVPIKPSEKKAKATALILFPQGNRSHGVVIAVDDRRHRPRDWKEGESGLYDDEGKLVKLSRDALEITTGASKKPFIVTIDGSTFTVTKDKIEAKIDKSTLTLEKTKTTVAVDGTKMMIQKDRIDLGGEGGSAVATAAGYSSKVFAIL